MTKLELIMVLNFHCFSLSVGWFICSVQCTPISKFLLLQDLSHHANTPHLQAGPPHHRPTDFRLHPEELVQGARPPHARRHHGHVDLLGPGIRLGAK